MRSWQRSIKQPQLTAMCGTLPATMIVVMSSGIWWHGW